MSKHLRQKKARSLGVTIGGAGLLLAAPAAALIVNPVAAQAAPQQPIDDLFGCALEAPLGADCLGADNVAVASTLTDGLALGDPFLDLAGGFQSSMSSSAMAPTAQRCILTASTAGC
jgi:hypothetical protein